MQLRTKFILIFIFISVFPIFVIAYFSFIKASELTTQIIFDDLVSSAEFAEGNILGYFQWQKIRVADWSSDGHIRSEVTALLKKYDVDRAKRLGLYIKNNKQILDKDVLLSDILDKKGRVIVSSDETRIGIDESEHLSGGIKNAKYGEASSEGIMIEPKENLLEPMFHSIVPVTSLDTGETIGILLNHVLVSNLQNILSGKMSVDLGSLTQHFSRRYAFDAYLVDRTDGLLLTDAKKMSVVGTTLTKKIETLPVKRCIKDNREVVGRYQNYQGEWVLGSSMCPEGHWWMLVLELDEAEALSDIIALKNFIYFVDLILTIIVILIAYLFSRSITVRVLANRHVVEEIAKGNFDARVKVVEKDDISMVGHGINYMADSLKEMTDKLILSEGKYRSLVESSVDCIKFFDMQGNLLFINEGGKKEHNLNNEVDVKNFKAIDTVIEEDRSGFIKAFEDAQKGIGSEIEIRHTKKGSIRNVCLETIYPIKDSTQRIIGVLGTSRDISERKRSEKNLLELKTAIDDSDNVIFITDIEGTITFINKRFSEFYGYDYNEVVNKVTPRILKSGLYSTEEYKIFWNNILSGEIIKTERTNKTKDGRFVDIEETVNPFFGHNKKIIGFISIQRDIAEKKRIAEKIKKLEETKNEFVSVAAHQLRTPLTSVRGNISMLLNGDAGPLAKDQYQVAKDISIGVNSMNELVEFLLKIVRAEARGIKFDLAPVDLKEVTDQSIEVLRSELDAKKQKIDVRQIPKNFPLVFMDKESISQVVRNLLSNAIHYSDSESTIVVDMKLKDLQVEYSVRDTGIGIPKDEQKNIFGKFFRASNAKRIVSTGTGLGLSLIKSFVDAWGGKIWFESEENKGTIFYITIPIIANKEAPKELVK